MECESETGMQGGASFSLNPCDLEDEDDFDQSRMDEVPCSSPKKTLDKMKALLQQFRAIRRNMGPPPMYSPPPSPTRSPQAEPCIEDTSQQRPKIEQSRKYPTTASEVQVPVDLMYPCETIPQTPERRHLLEEPIPDYLPSALLPDSERRGAFLLKDYKYDEPCDRTEDDSEDAKKRAIEHEKQLKEMSKAKAIETITKIKGKQKKFLQYLDEFPEDELDPVVLQDKMWAGEIPWRLIPLDEEEEEKWRIMEADIERRKKEELIQKVWEGEIPWRLVAEDSDEEEEFRRMDAELQGRQYEKPEPCYEEEDPFKKLKLTMVNKSKIKNKIKLLKQRNITPQESEIDRQHYLNEERRPEKSDSYNYDKRLNTCTESESVLGASSEIEVEVVQEGEEFVPVLPQASPGIGPVDLRQIIEPEDALTPEEEEAFRKANIRRIEVKLNPRMYYDAQKTADICEQKDWLLNETVNSLASEGMEGVLPYEEMSLLNRQLEADNLKEYGRYSVDPPPLGPSKRRLSGPPGFNLEKRGPKVKGEAIDDENMQLVLDESGLSVLTDISTAPVTVGRYSLGMPQNKPHQKRRLSGPPGFNLARRGPRVPLALMDTSMPLLCPSWEPPTDEEWAAEMFRTMGQPVERYSFGGRVQNRVDPGRRLSGPPQLENSDKMFLQSMGIRTRPRNVFGPSANPLPYYPMNYRKFGPHDPPKPHAPPTFKGKVLAKLRNDRLCERNRSMPPPPIPPDEIGLDPEEREIVQMKKKMASANPSYDKNRLDSYSQKWQMYEPDEEFYVGESIHEGNEPPTEKPGAFEKFCNRISGPLCLPRSPSVKTKQSIPPPRNTSFKALTSAQPLNMDLELDESGISVLADISTAPVTVGRYSLGVPQNKPHRQRRLSGPPGFNLARRGPRVPLALMDTSMPLLCPSWEPPTDEEWAAEMFRTINQPVERYSFGGNVPNRVDPGWRLSGPPQLENSDKMFLESMGISSYNKFAPRLEELTVEEKEDLLTLKKLMDIATLSTDIQNASDIPSIIITNNTLNNGEECEGYQMDYYDPEKLGPPRFILNKNEHQNVQENRPRKQISIFSPQKNIGTSGVKSFSITAKINRDQFDSNKYEDDQMSSPPTLQHENLDDTEEFERIEAMCNISPSKSPQIKPMYQNKRQHFKAPMKPGQERRQLRIVERFKQNDLFPRSFVDQPATKEVKDGCVVPVIDDIFALPTDDDDVMELRHELNETPRNFTRYRLCALPFPRYVPIDEIEEDKEMKDDNISYCIENRDGTNELHRLLGSSQLYRLEYEYNPFMRTGSEPYIPSNCRLAKKRLEEELNLKNERLRNATLQNILKKKDMARLQENKTEQDNQRRRHISPPKLLPQNQTMRSGIKPTSAVLNRVPSSLLRSPAPSKLNPPVGKNVYDRKKTASVEYQNRVAFSRLEKPKNWAEGLRSSIPSTSSRIRPPQGRISSHSIREPLTTNTQRGIDKISQRMKYTSNIPTTQSSSTAQENQERRHFLGIRPPVTQVLSDPRSKTQSRMQPFGSGHEATVKRYTSDTAPKARGSSNTCITRPFSARAATVTVTRRISNTTIASPPSTIIERRVVLPTKSGKPQTWAEGLRSSAPSNSSGTRFSREVVQTKMPRTSSKQAVTKIITRRISETSSLPPQVRGSSSNTSINPSSRATTVTVTRRESTTTAASTQPIPVSSTTSINEAPQSTKKPRYYIPGTRPKLPFGSSAPRFRTPQPKMRPVSSGQAVTKTVTRRTSDTTTAPPRPTCFPSTTSINEPTASTKKPRFYVPGTRPKLLVGTHDPRFRTPQPKTRPANWGQTETKSVRRRASDTTTAPPRPICSPSTTSINEPTASTKKPRFYVPGTRPKFLVGTHDPRFRTPQPKMRKNK